MKYPIQQAQGTYYICMVNISNLVTFRCELLYLFQSLNLQKSLPPTTNSGTTKTTAAGWAAFWLWSICWIWLLFLFGVLFERWKWRVKKAKKLSCWMFLFLENIEYIIIHLWTAWIYININFFICKSEFFSFSVKDLLVFDGLNWCFKKLNWTLNQKTYQFTVKTSNQ